MGVAPGAAFEAASDYREISGRDFRKSFAGDAASAADGIHRLSPHTLVRAARSDKD
jgi:hypothetical protein